MIEVTSGSTSKYEKVKSSEIRGCHELRKSAHGGALPLSGPALQQLQSHRSIHEAAYGEAEELTHIAKAFAEAGKEQAVLSTVRLLIEHWQTRTLCHATEEEEGFYKEVAMEYPEYADKIFFLTRDHNVMRQLVEEVEKLLVTQGSVHAMLDRFQMLLWLVERHSRDEEKWLLDVAPNDHAKRR